MPPHSLTSGRRWRFAETLDQIRRGLQGEGPNPLRTGVIERSVKLRERDLELLAFRRAVLDRLLTFLLIASDAEQLLAHTALRSNGALQTVLADANLIPGGVNRLMV